MNLTSINIIQKGTPNAHFYNKRGAKAYLDVMKHDLLDIPKIHSSQRGKVYTVLSIGHTNYSNGCKVTIKEGKTVKIYRLPQDPIYSGWVDYFVTLSLGTGINHFPCKVEFGYFIDKEHYYAELL